MDAVEEIGVTSTEDSPAKRAWAGAGGGESTKAQSAIFAAAYAEDSIASLKDPGVMDYTSVSWGADQSPSAGDSRFSRSWT